MEVNLESLIYYEKMKTDLDDIFKVDDKYGKVVILKDNEPVYILLKYNRSTVPIEKILGSSIPNRTLQEVMKIVLKKVEGRKMHAAEYNDSFICIAKTPNFWFDNPKILAVPKDFTLTLKSVNLSAGANFIIPLTGTVMTIPSFPKMPAAIIMEDELI